MKVGEVKVGKVMMNIDNVVMNIDKVVINHPGKFFSISYIVILTTIQGFGLNNLTKNPGFFITGLIFVGWAIYKEYFER